MKTKRILLSIGIVVLLFVAWILFKPYDYRAIIKAPTNISTVECALKIWNESLNNSKGIHKKAPNLLKQTLDYKDADNTYFWNIKKHNDSLSVIKVKIKRTPISLTERAKLYFFETGYKKEFKKSLYDFKAALKYLLENTKVKIIGKGIVPAKNYVYVLINTKQRKKAQGMMRHYSGITQYLIDKKIELDGTPFLEVKSWNQKTDSLSYRFCFPVKKQNNFPETPLYKYDERLEAKALKAIYNGNYKSSDIAWYHLIDYAKKNGIKIIKRPLEIFHNNPNYGSEELSWKTEVFMNVVQPSNFRNNNQF